MRRHALSFIFHGIYDFKEAKAPVTAARNSTSVLQRHNATLSSAIPYRLSPGGVKSHCVGTKHKNYSRTILRVRLCNVVIFDTGMCSQPFE